MAKEGFTIANLKPILRSRSKQDGWILCIGAGVSMPVFPMWNGLIADMIKEDPTITDNTAVEDVLKSFSYDALIQAAKDVFNKSDDEFIEYLTEKLYSNLKSQVNSKEWKAITRIFGTLDPNRFDDSTWEEFIKVRERLFKHTSSYSIAKLIVKSYEQNVNPEAILSFNAEPLLFALITSFQREPILGSTKKEGDLKNMLSLVTNGLSHKVKWRIPYIFCHGALLSSLTPRNNPNFKTTSKLVFMESSYLELGSNTYSWQSSQFMSYSGDSSIVFVGVSLTDPNIRRWLSWIQKDRIKELKNFNTAINENNHTKHYWINIRPLYKSSEKWIESSVSHLGVRLIWIDSWLETEAVFKKLLTV